MAETKRSKAKQRSQAPRRASPVADSTPILGLPDSAHVSLAVAASVLGVARTTLWTKLCRDGFPELHAFKVLSGYRVPVHALKTLIRAGKESSNDHRSATREAR